MGGGTEVTITGTGFTEVTGVDFGTVAATSFTVVNDTTITAVVPAGSLGEVDVTVVNTGGTSATGAGDEYTYVTPPGSYEVTTDSDTAATAGSLGYEIGQAEYWQDPAR